MTRQPSAATERRKRDPERRKREILSAAAEVVVEQGAAALTHRAVAARGDIPLGTITRHFPSIDELREATLRALGDEMDVSLSMIDRELARSESLPQRLAELMHDFLRDSRQVQAMMAQASVAVSDPSLRSLTTRWSDRLVAILAKHLTEEQAVALEVYLNGAIAHAAMHDRPLSLEALSRVIRAIVAMPAPGSEAP